jgi:hypothetical protein
VPACAAGAVAGADGRAAGGGGDGVARHPSLPSRGSRRARLGWRACLCMRRLRACAGRVGNLPTFLRRWADCPPYPTGSARSTRRAKNEAPTGAAASLKS